MNWRLAFAIWLYKDWITSHCSCCPSTPPERSSMWRSEVRHSMLWENRKNRSSDIYIQEILWAQFLRLLISRKALKCFMVTSAPHDQQQPSAKCILDYMHLPLHQNHTYPNILPYLSGSIFRGIWNATSQAIFLILPPIKFNSQLLRCAYVYKLTILCTFLPHFFKNSKMTLYLRNTNTYFIMSFSITNKEHKSTR